MFTVWENLNNVDWDKQLIYVAKINNIDDFQQLPHFDLSNFFTKTIGKLKYINYYEYDKRKITIYAVSVFRYGIRPEWEDKQCQKCGFLCYKDYEIERWKKDVDFLLSIKNEKILGF